MVFQIFADPTNAVDFISQLQYFNSLTDIGFGGILGIIILMIVGSGLFSLMKAFRYDQAIAVSFLVTSILAVFIRILNLINDQVFFIFIIMLVYSLYELYSQSSQGEV